MEDARCCSVVWCTYLAGEVDFDGLDANVLGTRSHLCNWGLAKKVVGGLREERKEEVTAEERKRREGQEYGVKKKWKEEKIVVSRSGEGLF